jgi:hypothetical protein
MWRVAALVAGGVLLVLVAAQLLLPPIFEGQVEDRLTEEGGEASAEVAAFPALRLVFGDGDRLRIEGDGIDLDPARRETSVERLDGFGEVEVVLTDVEVAPLRVASFRLTRAEGAANYELAMSADTSPRDVSAFLGQETGGFFGELLGGLAAGQLPDERIPMDLTAVLTTRDSEFEVVTADGSVAGVPAGPLVELVVGAVADRL